MDKLRLAVLGVGSVVREIYQYLYFQSRYANQLEIVAACDTDPDQLDWFAHIAGLPKDRCYNSYVEMIEQSVADAVAVNTPDSFHREPTVACMEAGLDVLLPKPLAATIQDAHDIIEACRKTGRLLGVDFHKRDDPLTKEAKTRVGQGVYGRLQSAVWYMVDQLQVADPNHRPRFFASEDFAARNSPVTFLTVHMADTFLFVSGAKPVRVRATGYKHKLPSLRPVAVDGYDLVDTEVLTDTGCLCHIITGWAIPNTAHALTVQSARIIGSEGLLDLGFDSLGYHEITHERLSSRNTSFRTFEPDGSVSGFGMSNPGRLLEAIAAHRAGRPVDGADRTTPEALGFWATVICEAAHESLERATGAGPCNGGPRSGGAAASGGSGNYDGVIDGQPVDVTQLLRDRLGEAASAYGA